IPFYSSPAHGKVDLLTLMAHELGHVLGYEDSGTDGLMAEYLGTGVRRLPTSTDMGPALGHTLPVRAAPLGLGDLAKYAGTPLPTPTTAQGAVILGVLPDASGVGSLSTPTGPAQPISVRRKNLDGVP